MWAIIWRCQRYAVSLHTVNRTDCGEEDTDPHTPVHSASDSDALQSSQVVGLLPYPGQRKISLSNLIQFHDVEHLEEDGIDVGVPALVKMTITPMGDGRGLHFGIDLIHDGTLLIQIEDQVGIILYQGTDTRLAYKITTNIFYCGEFVQ